MMIKQRKLLNKIYKIKESCDDFFPKRSNTIFYMTTKNLLRVKSKIVFFIIKIEKMNTPSPLGYAHDCVPIIVSIIFMTTL